MWSMIISAAASLAQGAASANANNKNADLEASTAAVNYSSIMDAGETNAKAIESAAMLNAAVGMMGANINADATMSIANYNANLQRELSYYNADVLMNETTLIWDAAELDVSNIEYQSRQDAGNILASFGASGVQINDTDSVVDVLVSAETQHQMNIEVVRHGADIEAGKLRDAAARGVYEGELAARQMLYEAQVSANNMKLSAGFNALGSMMQGSIDAGATRQNASISANQALQGGMVKSQQYKAAANQAMTSALFSAAGNAASSYVDNATASSSFKTPSGGGGAATTTPKFNTSTLSVAPTRFTSSQGTTYTASLI